MNLKEKLNNLDKLTVFETYITIISNFKEYNKITKAKMINSIIEEYKNSENIINLCTNKELKYLKLLANNKNSLSYNKKYDWEIKTLDNKFLIILIDDKIYIPKELQKSIHKAITKINLSETTKKDKINETLIGICKTKGIIKEELLIDIASKLLKIHPDEIINHINNNKLFNYYIAKLKILKAKNKDNDKILIYRSYYPHIEKIMQIKKQENKNKYNLATIEDYQSIFYNNLNLNNPKIYKFYNELIKLNNYDFYEWIIIMNILLKENQQDLIDFIKTISKNQIDNLDNFIYLLKETLKEMNKLT